MDRTLSQHINNDYEELDGDTLSSQRRRHLQDEVKNLEQYQQNHPGDEHDPTPLELFCDLHPDALECRIYDD